VLEPVEVVGVLSSSFFVVFCLQAVIFRCWPVKNGGCWRISGGVMFNARSVSLDWFLSNKNFPSAVAGLFWSGWLFFEAVQFVSGRCVTRMRMRRRFSSFGFSVCGLQLFSPVSEGADLSL
jgi:hypothetical protein